MGALVQRDYPVETNRAPSPENLPTRKSLATTRASGAPTRLRSTPMRISERS